MSEHGKNESYDESMEIKRGKTNEEEEVGEPTLIKKAPSGKNTILEKRPTSNIGKNYEVRPSSSHLKADVSLSKKK